MCWFSPPFLGDDYANEDTMFENDGEELIRYIIQFKVKLVLINYPLVVVGLTTREKIFLDCTLVA